MSIPEQQAAPAAPARTRHVGGSWFAWFTAVWIALWMSNQTPIQLLLAVQVTAHSDDWIEGVLAFGMVLGIGGALSFAAGPVAGVLSDRYPTRFGRRRPWAVAGSLVAAASLLALARTSDNLTVGIAWTVYSVGFAVACTAFTALIADQLDAQRGTASGVVGAAQGVGLVLGVAIVVLLGLSLQVSYVILAVAVAVAGVGGALALPDAAVAATPPVVKGSVRRKRNRDFSLIVLSRVLVSLGNGASTSMLLYFLLFSVGVPLEEAENHLLTVIVIFTVGVVLSSAVGGRLSDVRGGRRGMVVLGSVLMTVSPVILVLVHSVEAAMLSAVFNGLGYGLFLTVGLALATDYLPTETDTARDLSFVNAGTNAGAIVGPLVGAGLVAAAGGFQLMYAITGVLVLVGGLMLFALRRQVVATG